MKTKKWLRRKGCKNCALVWYEEPCYIECDSDCKGHGQWLVEPYYKDREFVFMSKIYRPTQEFGIFKNCYFNDKGNLVKIGMEENLSNHLKGK